MAPKKTNKEQLFKGIKFLAISLLVSFVAIYLISFSFINKIYTLTGLGVITMFLAIYLIFKGINTIIKSMFDEN